MVQINKQYSNQDKVLKQTGWSQLTKYYRALKSSLKPRALPSFIIIGAQKCGTTSLNAYLRSHPNVCRPVKSDQRDSRKELNFFDENFEKGVSWYRACFPRLLEGFITGEATPTYLFHPHVPKRMASVLPDVKLIVLLRNPTERAYSHYYHNVRKNRETISFEEAIAAESERASGEFRKMLEDEHYFNFNYKCFAYLSRGIYVDQFKRWFEFFPREQILILKFEDFAADPTVTFRQVLNFLDLPSWEPKEYKQYNSYEDKSSMSYPSMNTETRSYLINYFKPHNERLYEYLGVDFDWN